MIETYALENLLHKNRLYEYPSYHNLKNAAALEIIATTSPEYAAANDQFNKWYITNDIVIRKGTWFDRPNAYIHIYGKRKADCEKFMQSLIAEGIIE